MKKHGAKAGYKMWADDPHALGRYKKKRKAKARMQRASRRREPPMKESTRQKVIAVRTAVAAGKSVEQACKEIGIHVSYYYHLRSKVRRKKSELLPAVSGRGIGSVHQKADPIVYNVQVPESEEVNVVIIKGKSDALRDIVSGLGGILRG